MTKRQRIYFAHALCCYGKEDERAEVRLIRKTFRGSTIVNPARYSDHPEKIADVMGFCFKLIDQAQIIVFSRCLGKITSGMGKEINYALKSKKQVFEIKSEKMIRRTQRVKHISRAASRRLYWKYWALERASKRSRAGRPQ